MEGMGMGGDGGSANRPDGIYHIHFAGMADTGTGTIIFENGRVHGEDEAGVRYNGTYTLTTGSDDWNATVEVRVPAGVSLVQGVPGRPQSWSFKLDIPMKSNFGSGFPIPIKTPFGLVMTTFRPIAPDVSGLYLSLVDEELRARCLDLLKLKDNFDRVVNQATQVLEARIQKKSGGKGTSSSLVNAVIKAEASSTILKFSDDNDEQQGLAFLYKGIMLAMRNKTHHAFHKSFTREDALKVCAFIDILLSLVDGATVQNPQP